MAKLTVKAGSTSRREYVFVLDSASTTGAGKTGIAYNAAGIKAYYVRPGGSATLITLATQTVTGAYSSGGWVEVDSTNMPGVYRFDIPDAVFAASAEKAIVMVSGATGMAPIVLEYDLVAYDSQDTVRLGLTALPNAASGSAGAIITSGTGTAQLSTTSGNVTVGTNNDKTGYSLTQAFPTNFSSLAITAGGAVTVGTNNDKTGYSLTQTFPANFSSLAITVGGAVTAGTVSDKTGYSLATSQTFSTTGSVGSVTGSVGSVTGAVGSVTGAVGSVTGDVGGKVLGGGASAITGDGVRASSVTGSVGSVTGAVGSVTGNVGGNVVGSVASVTNAVTVGTINANAVTASALATDAAQEIADTVLTRNVSNVEASLATPTYHNLGTIILAMLENSVSGTTLTIRQTGGTTLTTKTLTTASAATANVITGVD